VVASKHAISCATRKTETPLVLLCSVDSVHETDFSSLDPFDCHVFIRGTSFLQTAAVVVGIALQQQHHDDGSIHEHGRTSSGRDRHRDYMPRKDSKGIGSRIR
jgi:hypothetical protein